MEGCTIEVALGNGWPGEVMIEPIGAGGYAVTSVVWNLTTTNIGFPNRPLVALVAGRFRGLARGVDLALFVGSAGVRCT